MTMRTTQMPSSAYLGATVKRLFTHFINNGLSSFQKDKPLFVYRERGILTKRIGYYEQKEENENCCVLKLMQQTLDKKNCSRLMEP
jgi:hypothetical protein